MTMLIEAAEKLDKIQHSFMIETPNKLEVYGDFFDLVKNICKKSTTNILKTFPLG